MIDLKTVTFKVQLTKRMYTNEELALAVLRIDHLADWVYNKHCRSCGAFLYDLKNKCRKCKAVSNDPINRALPFTTSATALEGLTVWLKTKYFENPAKYIDIYYSVIDLNRIWLISDITVAEYHQTFVNTVGTGLGAFND